MGNNSTIVGHNYSALFGGQKIVYFFSPEPTAMFTAVALLQFRLGDIQRAQKLEVEGAELSVGIRTPLWQRQTRDKFVRLTLSAVNYQGETNATDASVSMKVNNPKPNHKKYRIKTKRVRLKIPKIAIQQALESENQTLGLYLSCEGCEDVRRDLNLICKHRDRYKHKDYNIIEEEPTQKKRNRKCAQRILIDPILVFGAKVTKIRDHVDVK